MACLFLTSVVEESVETSADNHVVPLTSAFLLNVSIPNHFGWGDSLVGESIINTNCLLGRAFSIFLHYQEVGDGLEAHNPEGRDVLVVLPDARHLHQSWILRLFTQYIQIKNQ